MSTAEAVWRLNIPELLGLPDFSLDDADTDAQGNVYVSDGVNGRVFKFLSDGTPNQSFDVVRTSEDSSLNLSVASDSTFCVADAGEGVIYRYDESGKPIGEFDAPGVLSLCRGRDGLISVLVSGDDEERVNIYHQSGALVDVMPAPTRHCAHLDPGLANLDCDMDGNIYVSYGMPPYRVWKVKADGSGIDTWSRYVDFPEDAILISDISVNPDSGVLWVLLACKQYGRQILDAFSLDGEFLGTVEIPHSDTLYGVACAVGGSDLYLLNTGTGPGSGDLARISLSKCNS